jgi:hypothetical protein
VWRFTGARIVRTDWTAQGAEAEKAVPYLALRRTIRAVRIETNNEAAPHGRPT